MSPITFWGKILRLIREYIRYSRRNFVEIVPENTAVYRRDFELFASGVDGHAEVMVIGLDIILAPVCRHRCRQIFSS